MICNGNVYLTSRWRTRSTIAAGKRVPVPGLSKPLVADWVDAAYVHGRRHYTSFLKATQRPPEHAVDELATDQKVPGEERTAQPLTNIAAPSRESSRAR